MLHVFIEIDCDSLDALICQIDAWAGQNVISGRFKMRVMALLWVDEAAREAGLGGAAKRGYQEFGRIDNHTNGYYLAFMMKKL